MTIRRVNKPGAGAVAGSKGARTGSTSGENFAQFLEGVAATRGARPAGTVDAVRPAGEEGSSHQRREQLERAGALLDSLEELGRGLNEGDVNHDIQLRDRLRETRDEALRTLSSGVSRGEERDLLHRTAVMATVELAKSDRGDYN